MAGSSNMATAQTTFSRTATPSNGSRTIEVRPQPVLRLSAPSGVLRLRAEPTEQRHIQWAEDVVDNEGMGKKSSKGTVPAKPWRQLWHANLRNQSAASITSPALPTNRQMMTPQTHPPRTQTQIQNQITALLDPQEGLEDREGAVHMNTTMTMTTIAATMTLARVQASHQNALDQDASPVPTLTRRCQRTKSRHFPNPHSRLSQNYMSNNRSTALLTPATGSEEYRSSAFHDHQKSLHQALLAWRNRMNSGHPFYF